MNLLSDLDRPIAFQRKFVELTGSVTGAILLSQAVYWQKRCRTEDGWWHKTLDQWTEETGMSRKEMETARRGCSKYLEYKVKGLPAKGFYRIRLEFCDPVMVQTSLSESDKLDRPKGTNKIAPFGRSTKETTSETTSETSTKGGVDPDKLRVEQAEEIYAAYPLKVGKPEALRAIIKCLKEFPFTTLLHRTNEFASVRNGDTQFCPHPSTWFNQERFNDDPSTWITSNLRPATSNGIDQGPSTITLRPLTENKKFKEILAREQAAANAARPTV